MRFQQIAPVQLFVCLLGLGACSASRDIAAGRPDGAQSIGEAKSVPLVVVGPFLDRREGEKETESAGSEVKAAFSTALEKRGMLADEGRELYEITGDILNFDTSPLIRPHASARIRVRVSSRRGGGVPLFSAVYSSEHQEKGIPLWSPASTGKSTDAGKTALAKAVDAALEDPRLLRVLVY